MKVAYNNCHGGFGISKECAEWLANRGNVECIDKMDSCKKGEEFYGDLYKTDRHDVLLVMAIEELGKKANGTHADLKIHELKGNRYKIDEYDGWEDVMEPNNIDWVVIS